MLKDVVKRALVALLMLFLLVFSSQSVSALTRIRDNTDISAINLYQLTLTRENMEVVSKDSSVIEQVIPANGSYPKDSTLFSLRVDKSQNTQTFTKPIVLKFANAGVVYGKTVDVYVTVNSVTTHLVNRNADYQNSSKTNLAFLTVDENWGTKSIQIMDYIDVTHPNINDNVHQAYWFDADVTAEFRYQDGSEMDLKMVMTPSDIDVINPANTSLRESFSLYDMDSTVGKIVMNNNNNLNEATVGNKTTWTPTNPSGTSGSWAEHNVTGMAVRSNSGSMTFSYGTTAVCGGLFGFYTEIPSKTPVKEVDTTETPSAVGKQITYTTHYTMPVPGKDVIGNLDSMKMSDTFDERLDFQSLTVQLDGNTLSEGTDYTKSVDGQTVTVTIAKQHLTAGNGGKEYTIVYNTVTNSKILQDGADITNRVLQEVDNVPSYSNTVTTKVLFKKTHEYKSGVSGKDLPQAVLDLLPPDVENIANGTRVTPDPPKDNKTKVSTADGNWVFQGYDKDFEVIDSKDAHFIGTWVLEEFPTPSKTVSNSAGDSIDGKQAKPGDILTYTISYTNTTDEDRQVTITDTIPDLTEYVDGSADQSGVYANGKVTWTQTVVKDATWTVSFRVKVKDTANGEVITNTAQVSDGLRDIDTNPTKNPTPTKPVKDVLDDTNTSIDGKQVKAGQVLTYSVTYKNTTGESQEVTITDTIPAHTSYVDGSADYSGTYANNTVTWTQTVADGASLTVTFKVKVDDDVNDDLVENTAQVLVGGNTVNTNTTKNPTPKQFLLPKTGGAGTLMYLLIGSLVTLSFALLQMVYRRKAVRKGY